MLPCTYTEAGNNCPLCEHPAECTLYDWHNNAKHVRCDNCNEFIITCTAEEILLQYSIEIRAQYSVLSKKSNDKKLLHIKSPSANSNKLVDATFEPRSSKNE